MLGAEPGEDGEQVGVVEGTAEAFGGEAPCRGPLLAEQVACEMAQDRQIRGPLADTHPALVLAEGHIEDPMDAMLNGLIANDKICVVRHVRLKYSPARWSSRGQRRAALPAYPSDETDRRGGGHETALAQTTEAAGATG
jgi:hypothetical protein